jgi:hypothetical protein
MTKLIVTFRNFANAPRKGFFDKERSNLHKKCSALCLKMYSI